MKKADRRGRTKAVEARDAAVADVSAVVDRHGIKAVASAVNWLRKREKQLAEARELRQRAEEIEASVGLGRKP